MPIFEMVSTLLLSFAIMAVQARCSGVRLNPHKQAPPNFDSLQY